MKRIFNPTSTIGKNMKTFIFIFLSITLLFNGKAFSQEEEKKESDDGKKPARPAFASSLLMEEQSVLVPTKKTLQFDLQHRFGTVENGASDIFGIYAASANIRMALTYSPIKNLSVGLGVTKLKQYIDLNAKYSLLKQTKDWSMPVSVSIFGNIVSDNRGGSYEGSFYPKNSYKYSYFSELIIACRVSSKLSLQVTPSFSHYNAADTLMNHDMFAIGFSGRYKISNQSSFMVNYIQQLTKHASPNYNLKPGITVGWEIATSGHAFQIFATSFQGILPQENITFNQNDFTNRQWMIGFNITRLWNF